MPSYCGAVVVRNVECAPGPHGSEPGSGVVASDSGGPTRALERGGSASAGRGVLAARLVGLPPGSPAPATPRRDRPAARLGLARPLPVRSLRSDRSPTRGRRVDGPPGSVTMRFVSRVDVRQLRWFACVAEAGSISEAGRRLYVAQPALTRQISALERAMGRRLLDRTASGSTLTEEGRRFLAGARTVLAAYDALVTTSTGPSAESPRTTAVPTGRAARSGSGSRPTLRPARRTWSGTSRGLGRGCCGGSPAGTRSTCGPAVERRAG